MKIPQIKAHAEKMIWICLLLIASYLIFTAAYAHLSTEPQSRLITRDMLETALLSTVISLGGGLLLDCEIRLAENK
ncbi:MAG: hypothetical protein IJN48_02455 [Clostridia bacterium]|nr:hypothetical protein [Clostridia bacterium]